MAFSEKEILEQLDLSSKGIPTSYYPEGKSGDIKYNFFLDLEHGYCETAGNRIHLYADSVRWAIVFEKSGYQNRGFSAGIQLDYVGNCITYSIEKYADRNYITNSSLIMLITPDEYKRISKEGSDIEQFELISPKAKEVNIRDVKVNIEHDAKKYEDLGIKLSEYKNPKKLIDFGSLVRYLNETNPTMIAAREEEIKKHLPHDLPKIMTINEFHFVSVYGEDNLPSKQETYQLIAKILVSRDTTLWKPTLKANNHWSNWESGNL